MVRTYVIDLSKHMFACGSLNMLLLWWVVRRPEATARPTLETDTSTPGTLWKTKKLQLYTGGVRG